MTLFALLITLGVVGGLLWLFNKHITMDDGIKRIINIVVAVCVLVYVASAFGLCSHVNDIKVPRL